MVHFALDLSQGLPRARVESDVADESATRLALLGDVRCLLLIVHPPHHFAGAGCRHLARHNNLVTRRDVSETGPLQLDVRCLEMTVCSLPKKQKEEQTVPALVHKETKRYQNFSTSSPRFMTDNN